MARAGHDESLANWMPLSTWLALALYDLLLPVLHLIIKAPNKPPESTSKIIPKIIGNEAAAKMRAAHAKMKTAIDISSISATGSEGVEDSIVELMELLSGIWLMKIGDTGTKDHPGFKEQARPEWLVKYLSDPKENARYDAWSWTDKSKLMRSFRSLILLCYSYYSSSSSLPYSLVCLFLFLH